jgi:hypothetical protein
MPAAVILADNTIAAVLMADATVDALPPGFPEGAHFVNAPAGCNETWTYDGTTFTAPIQRSMNKVEF